MQPYANCNGAPISGQTISWDARSGQRRPVSLPVYRRRHGRVAQCETTRCRTVLIIRCRAGRLEILAAIHGVRKFASFARDQLVLMSAKTWSKCTSSATGPRDRLGFWCSCAHPARYAIRAVSHFPRDTLSLSSIYGPTGRREDWTEPCGTSL
jgi:hypothetical protein